MRLSFVSEVCSDSEFKLIKVESCHSDGSRNTKSDSDTNRGPGDQLWNSLFMKILRRTIKLLNVIKTPKNKYEKSAQI